MRIIVSNNHYANDFSHIETTTCSELNYKQQKLFKLIIKLNKTSKIIYVNWLSSINDLS